MGIAALPSRLIRGVHPFVVRFLVIVDVALAMALPPWAWFLFLRWTGKALGPVAFAKFWWQAAGFIIAHLRHHGEGTGALNVDWFSAPVRGCQQPEQPDYQPKGSCGTCRSCCTTSWLPEAKRHSCPFLGAKGCTIYGGLYWDYFNCGRYPATPSAVSSYGCPRFVGVAGPRPLPVAPPHVALASSTASR